ncbi:MAG: UDP-glucose 4-epimerase GalE [Oricola sp.]
MKTILVTGGAGYIGSHTCKSLAANGYVPVTYDNLVNGHRSVVKWGPFEHGDILDRARLDEVGAKYKPEAVIHFAAHAYVNESVTDPGKYYRNNVAGALNLIDAMRVAGIGKIVFSSSCATYGIPPSVPITEDTPQVPINPYGMSKLFVERMLADFGAAHGLRWIALRYFNAAGADPECETGEDHDPETRIIPIVLAAADKMTGPFTVFGTDYETPDGTCIRDYIHVSDLAGAHVKALQALDDGLASQGINLGTGTGYSIMQVIEAARAVTGLDVPFVTGTRRTGDPAALVADPARARQALGWRPAHADLRDIVSTAWKWHLHKKQRNSP